jgi:hypothetical protein
VEAIRDRNPDLEDATPYDRRTEPTPGFDLDGSFLPFENRAMAERNNFGWSNV